MLAPHEKLLRCALIISVGRPEHEGRKLAAAINFINKKFSYCDIAICDTLQRHTIAMFNDLTEKDALFVAEQAGIEWFKRNQEILNLLTIKHDFLCWDEWLRSKEFEKLRQKVLFQCENDAVFRKNLDETIHCFLSRAQKKCSAGGFDFGKAYQHCSNYLIEESAIMMLIWPEKKYHYVVYPHAVPKVLDEAHKRFVLPKYPDFLHWLEIKFEKRGKNSPLYQKTGVIYGGEEIIDNIKVSCVN